MRLERHFEEEGHRPEAGPLVKEVKVCVVLVRLSILAVFFDTFSRLFLLCGRRFLELFRGSSLFAWFVQLWRGLFLLRVSFRYNPPSGCRLGFNCRWYSSPVTGLLLLLTIFFSFCLMGYLRILFFLQFNPLLSLDDGLLFRLTNTFDVVIGLAGRRGKEIISVEAIGFDFFLVFKLLLERFILKLFLSVAKINRIVWIDAICKRVDISVARVLLLPIVTLWEQSCFVKRPLFRRRIFWLFEWLASVNQIRLGIVFNIPFLFRNWVERSLNCLLLIMRHHQIIAKSCCVGSRSPPQGTKETIANEAAIVIEVPESHILLAFSCHVIRFGQTTDESWIEFSTVLIFLGCCATLRAFFPDHIVASDKIIIAVHQVLQTQVQVQDIILDHWGSLVPLLTEFMWTYLLMKVSGAEINIVVVILMLLDFCCGMLVQMHISVGFFVSAGQKIVFEFLVFSLLDLHVVVTHCVCHLIWIASLKPS